MIHYSVCVGSLLICDLPDEGAITWEDLGTEGAEVLILVSMNVSDENNLFSSMWVLHFPHNYILNDTGRVKEGWI